MGRKPKQGIDYFPADVDMFQDRKIKRLLRAAGGKGFTIYIYLLTHIYRENGYYLEWDANFAFDVADDLNLPESVVEEAVNVCCAHGLFNKDMFMDMGVLTSESIQQRWQKIVIEAKRVETDIEPRLLINKGVTPFPTEEKVFPTEETEKPSMESTQSKVKESKVKNTLSNTRGPAYEPQKIEPPETVEKVIQIGAMKAIPAKACEVYWDLRLTDNFLRMDKNGQWKPILNWHADLAHLYKKGALDIKQPKSKNGYHGNSSRKTKGDRAVEFLQRP